VAPSWLDLGARRHPRQRRAFAGLASTGRAVRLADLDGDRRADLCEIDDAGKLSCAAGNGAGGFAAATVIRALPVGRASSSAMSTVMACLTRGQRRRRDPVRHRCSQLRVRALDAGVRARRPADTADRSLAAIDSDDNGSAEICRLAFNGSSARARSLGAAGRAVPMARSRRDALARRSRRRPPRRLVHRDRFGAPRVASISIAR
jgi:hypothetical protein